MDNKNEFKPYIPADKIVPEFTVTSVLIGIILAIVFGAANAYLGLLVGMTISASIPAAVISMGIIRIILRRDSILENNLVQTIGSAGESLAAGAIFTLPALFLWAKEGKMAYPSIITIFLIALFGGILGVCFMVPLRQALIVEEHGTLPFPEGTACAEVLLAGEEGGSKAGAVFSGLGIAAVYKFVADGLKLFPSEIGYAFKGYAGSQIGIQVLPSLAGVGFICGPKISSYMLAGGALSWFVLMPAIALFGADATIYPGTKTIAAILADPEQGPGGLWTNYIKYIGAGAVAAGGLISLIKTFPLIIRTFKQAMSSMGRKHENKNVVRTQQDLPMSVLLIIIVAIVILIWLIPTFPVNPHRISDHCNLRILLCISILANGRSDRILKQPGIRYGHRNYHYCHSASESYRHRRCNRYGGSHRNRRCNLYHCRNRRRYFSGLKDRIYRRRNTEETADR